MQSALFDAVDLAAHGLLAGVAAQSVPPVAGAVHVAFVVEPVEGGIIPVEGGTTPAVFETPPPVVAGVRRGPGVPKTVRGKIYANVIFTVTK